ncbi:MAG: sterol carrier protein domain-containing protein, partial [Anaerolineales bacterium]|nr:sterol carrier protein domain-containing protein [Anaerolineales bacterium]
IRAANNGAADVKLRIQMADFSAVLMGCTNLADLHRLGLVTLSDPTWLEVVDGLFRLPQPPICVTPF